MKLFLMIKMSIMLMLGFTAFYSTARGPAINNPVLRAAKQKLHTTNKRTFDLVFYSLDNSVFSQAGTRYPVVAGMVGLASRYPSWEAPQDQQARTNAEGIMDQVSSRLKVEFGESTIRPSASAEVIAATVRQGINQRLDIVSTENIGQPMSYDAKSAWKRKFSEFCRI